MSLRRMRLKVSLVASLAVIATGCSTAKTDAGGDRGPEPRGDEQCTADLKGGKITMGARNLPSTLDPVTQNSGVNGGNERAAIYDSLMRYDPETNKYEPHLAESLVGSDDSTEWKLVLRDGIKFSNGDPLTAEVVKTSISRHIDGGATTNVINIVSLIDEMEVVDDLNLTFRLSEPYGTFPFVLSVQGGEITNPAVVKELGEDFGFKAAPGMGLGPYDVDGFRLGEELVLKAKDDYWGGPVCIDEIKFINVPSGPGTYEAFELDEIQIGYFDDPRSIDDVKQDNVRAFQPYSYGGSAVLINNGMSNPDTPGADIRIREAVTAAINPDVMNQRRWDGLATPKTSFIKTPGAPLSVDIDGPPYDPERAKKLVAEAKADGWDGKIRQICPNDPNSTEGAIAQEALLSAVGMDVDTSLVSTADLVNAVVIDRNFDLACWGIGAQPESPYIGLSGYHSESGTNFGQYSNPDMDAVIEDLQAAAKPEDQQAALVAFQEIWNKDFPGALYAESATAIAFKDSVHGLVDTSWRRILFHNAYVK